jgi:hypothetical protein
MAPVAAGDGKVDYEEFLAATMHLGKLEREENLYRAFQVRDPPALLLHSVGYCCCGPCCIAVPSVLPKLHVHTA